MAAFRSAGAAASANGGNVTPTLPPGWQTGDVLVLPVSTWGTTPITLPSGWTIFAAGNSGNTNGLRATLAWKLAESGETAPTVTWTGGNRIIAQALAFSGSAGLDVAGTPQGTLNSTTVNATEITPTVANTLVCFAAHSEGPASGSYTVSGYSGTDPTFVEAVQSHHSLGSPSLALAYGSKGGATTTGARTATLSSAYHSVGVLFALKPSALGGSGGAVGAHKTTHEPGGGDALSALTHASVAAANKDGAAATLCLRSLGTDPGQSAPGANSKGFVNHGSTATTARPSGYASVEWEGSVAPSNAVDYDTWISTA